jgi:hypothetical protein
MTNAECRMTNAVNAEALRKASIVQMGRSIAASVLALLSACGSPGTPSSATGLTGTVVRSPVTPVCTVNVPCSAPFSAGFTVDHNGTPVAHFRSDTAGHFTVVLAPGTYRVVPDADAPVISPTSQVKTVTVGGTGLTPVMLEFDTGIR